MKSVKEKKMKKKKYLRSSLMKGASPKGTGINDLIHEASVKDVGSDAEAEEDLGGNAIFQSGK